jgi:hypothetical protein
MRYSHRTGRVVPDEGANEMVINENPVPSGHTDGSKEENRKPETLNPRPIEGRG